MRLHYWIAATLALLASVVRTIDGVTGPLREAATSALAPSSVMFFRLTWHMVTLAMAIAGITLVRLAMHPRSEGATFVSWSVLALFSGWALMLAITNVMHGWPIARVIPMLVMIAIALFTYLGVRSHRTQPADMKR